MRRSELQRFALSSRVRRLGAFFAAFAVPVLLGGCFLGRENPDAGLDIPAAYRAGPRGSDKALPAVLWWRGFRSKQLTDLVEESLTSNLDIAAAVARIVQADAQSRIAGAPLLPGIDFGASAVRSRASQSTGIGSSGSSGPAERTTYSTSLSASYELDFWGKNRAALRAAEETAVASRFDREVVALTTVVSVANAYFQVLSSTDRLRIANDNLAAATRVFKLIQERFDAGVASALDVAQQEALVNAQRASIPPLEQIRRQAVATLAVLIGRTPERVTVQSASMYGLAMPRGDARSAVRPAGPAP